MSPNNAYRFEFKYPVSSAQGQMLEQEIIAAGLYRDSHATYDDGSYDVTSLYYDSYNLFDFDEKVGGFRERKKVRLRIYEPYLENSSYGFLEIKHKFGMRNRKSKIKLTREDLDAFLLEGKRVLLERAWQESEQNVKDIILSHLIRRSVRPTAFVTYRRSAYATPDTSIRITFDRELHTKGSENLSVHEFLLPVAPNVTIMEVKYQDLLPHWMKRVILSHNLKHRPFSKYEKSINTIHRHHPVPR